MNASDGLAWHYTTGHICRKILECGLLVPTAIGIKPPEKGIIEGWRLVALFNK
jgi:hypothetical protein